MHGYVDEFHDWRERRAQQAAEQAGPDAERRLRAVLAVALLVMLALALLLAARATPQAQPAAVAGAPACQEDAVLVGSGEFEAGRWTAYECGPAVDNFTP